MKTKIPFTILLGFIVAVVAWRMRPSTTPLPPVTTSESTPEPHSNFSDSEPSHVPPQPEPVNNPGSHSTTAHVSSPDEVASMLKEASHSLRPMTQEDAAREVNGGTPIKVQYGAIIPEIKGQSVPQVEEETILEDVTSNE